MKNYKLLLAIAVVSIIALGWRLNEKPVLYIIGDSTVKNGSGKGADSLWGWGNFIA